MVTINTKKRVHFGAGFIINTAALALLGLAFLLNDGAQAQTFTDEYDFVNSEGSPEAVSETAASEMVSQEEQVQVLNQRSPTPSIEPVPSEERARATLCGLYARCGFWNLSYTFDTGVRTRYVGPIVYQTVDGIGQNTPVCQGGRSEAGLIGDVGQIMALNFCQENGMTFIGGYLINIEGN